MNLPRNSVVPAQIKAVPQRRQRQRRLFGPAGYYKDGFGIVHLTGQLQSCTKNTSAFILPPGFRPTVATIHAVPDQVEVGAEIEVLPSGAVVPFGTANPSLGGITFRAS